jgi:hypothetical protein
VQATLQILAGPEAGRKIHLTSGLVARFGRTEWSDFAFSYDPALADVHFSIETTDDTVLLTDLSQGDGVQVDGQKMTECRLRSGQKIQAGSLTFVVTTERLFETSSSGTGPVAVARQSVESARSPELARKVCEAVELSEPAQGLLDDEIEVLPFIDKLSDQTHLLDALRVLGAWLDKRKAVWWGAGCLESACGERLEGQAELLALARAWVRDPTDENRRAALGAAETAETKLPACWLARAAGWSGGSLAPPGMAAVPPDERLTAQALVGALLLAAVFGDPAKSADNYRLFIDQGKQLSQTTLDWEK